MAIKKTSQITILAFVLLSSVDPSCALENVRLAYPSLSSSVFYFVIAQKQGYYREEGLNVEILSVRGEVAIKTALAGEVDFFTNAGSALAAAVREVPVKIIAVTQDRPSWDLIVQPEIKSIAQLRGTTIGIMSPEGSIAVATREILRKNGIDPAKDANLIVMGADDVRFMALKGKAIQATLMNPATSFMAQKEGFMKLTSAGEYMRYIQGGIATTDEKIKREPAKIAKFVRASVKGLNYFLTKREPSINYMMDILKLKDRHLASAIYDYDSKIMLRDGVTEEKLLQGLIEDMKKITKINREIKVTDIFEFSFVGKANAELKESGWKP
jgi:ABC-type nitrate/sulfonate/bicarbonate transport system substrate-binding protein